MRRFLALAAAGILAVLLISCGREGFDPGTMEPSPVTEPGEKVTMRLTEDRFDRFPEELNLVITNHTSAEYNYGVDYRLEVELDGGWYVVEPTEDMMFIALGVILPADAINSESLNLAEGYRDLPEGRYRLVKSFYGEGTSTEATAEFLVQAA